MQLNTKLAVHNIESFQMKCFNFDYRKESGFSIKLYFMIYF